MVTVVIRAGVVYLPEGGRLPPAPEGGSFITMWRRAWAKLLLGVETKLRVTYPNKEGILKEPQFRVLAIVDAFPPEK